MRCYGGMEGGFRCAIFRSAGGRLSLLVEPQGTCRRLQAAGTVRTDRACHWEMFG